MINQHITEIKLSRELTKQLESIINTLPENIQSTYKELIREYQRQIDDGIM
jgi:hypothetical protein